MNRFSRNQLAMISDSYKTSQRRIAREASRSDKPEDIFAQGFASSFLAAFVGLLARFVGLFRRNKGSRPTDRRHHARGTPSNGAGTKRDRLACKSSAVRGFSSSAGWTDRKTRRYAKRGYGYQTPDNVERLQKKSYKMRTATV